MVTKANAIRYRLPPDHPLLAVCPADRIVQVVANHYRLPVSAVMGRLRTARVAWARQVAMSEARMRNQNLSTTQIGQMFWRDHSTIICATQAVRNAEDVYPAVAEDLKKLRQEIDEASNNSSGTSKR